MTDHDKYRWDEQYSSTAKHLKSSEIRNLFSVVSRPEVVSLAGGMPNLKDLPLHDLASSTSDLLEQEGTVALQYGGGIGWIKLREKILELMALEQIQGVSAENVCITTGSQQALDLVTSLFVDPGDVILAESPSYVGALGVFGGHEAEVYHVDMDEYGLEPNALEKAILDFRAQGKKIKFIYTIPNFHNPYGLSQSVERRLEIVKVAKKHEVLIVEDNPYGLLSFEGQTYPALQSFWPEGVIYLGSFSKIFAPGYRIGWALLPDYLTAKFVQACEAAILCPSMMGQMSIYYYLNNYDWKQQIKSFQALYQVRWQAMEQALKENLSYCKWTTPQGGFYTWVTVPEGIDTKELLPKAVENLVAYVPGTAFYYQDYGRSNMRLSFCHPTPENIKVGVKRLSEVLDRELGR